jgi:8-oxo-dGTP pyrophosphatase MutT (NUDIX family)
VKNLPRTGTEPLYEPLDALACMQGLGRLVELGELKTTGKKGLGPLARELREECGEALKVDSVWLMDDYAFMRSDGVPVLGLSYVARWLSGEPVLNEENQRFEWVTVDESKMYALIPDIHGELEQAQRRMEPF